MLWFIALMTASLQPAVRVVAADPDGGVVVGPLDVGIWLSPIPCGGTARNAAEVGVVRGTVAAGSIPVPVLPLAAAPLER